MREPTRNMSTPRTARRAARVTRRRPWLIPAVAAVVLLLVAGGVAFAVSKVKTASIKPVTKDAAPASMPSIPATDEATPTVAASGESTAAVEVPSVIGKPVSTGVTIVDAAGLKSVTRVADKAVAGVAADAVVAQDPPQGVKVPCGSTVTLTYNPKAAPTANIQVAPTGIVVAIDAGHQTRGDNSLEPIGPGSTTMKAKVAGGLGPSIEVDPDAASSKRAAQLIGTDAAAATGTSARYRGDEPHPDMTGLNWATVPSMIIEGGFLSNPEDNRLIVTDAYQQKLAQGIASGVMKYLGR